MCGIVTQAIHCNRRSQHACLQFIKKYRRHHVWTRLTVTAIGIHIHSHIGGDIFDISGGIRSACNDAIAIAVVAVAVVVVVVVVPQRE